MRRNSDGHETGRDGPTHGRSRLPWTLCLVATVALAGPASIRAQGEGSTSAIVEDALKNVEKDQARDAERVRRMVEEAVKGAEQAPSGQDAVNPTAPEELRSLGSDRPDALPVGLQPQDLLNKPVRDGTGARIGTVQDLVVDEPSGAARAIVAFQPLFGLPGKTSVLELEALVPVRGQSDGFVVELTPVEYERMPDYRRDQAVWRRAGT
ncbi:PRC-barrel domain-containing protein [Benzoatithermus flavus]|uniref:PRC-barrel domain-containing protein n=1 Tax=Benzoatithermus flavus TaxID=3108223 RepID=A0ABU8XM26_9PROT